MLLHADNFTIYGGDESLMLNGIYAENGGCTLVTDPDGISGGMVLRPGWNGFNTNTNWRYVLQTGATTKAGVALRWWNSTLPPSNNLKAQVIQFRDGANNVLLALGALSTGQLEVQSLDNAGNPTNYDTLVPVITAQGWYHIEILATHTGGMVYHVEVRVEGVNVLTVDTAATRAADIAQIAAYHVQIGGDVQENFIKDLVIYNGSGTENNDFLGSVLVSNLNPLTDVALNWGLTGGATGHDILSNIPPNDAAFIYALHIPPPAGPYVGTLSDLPVDTSSVKGVITFVRAAKSDGGDGSLQVGVISNGVTGLGSDRPITVAQTYWRDVFELDPDTGAPWLPAAVNATEIQINRTT